MSQFLYRSQKVEVRESEIAGKGLFAIEDIKKDELISVKTGNIVTLEQLKTLDPTCLDYFFQIRDGLFISPLTKEEALEFALHINHSCDPNVGSDGDITLIAMKDIKSGEELTYDYAMDTVWPEFKMECSCGSTHCRKLITGNDWKLPALQERYGNYFSYYILKELGKSMK